MMGISRGISGKTCQLTGKIPQIGELIAQILGVKVKI